MFFVLVITLSVYDGCKSPHRYIVRLFDNEDQHNTHNISSDSENEDSLLIEDVESDVHDEPSDAEEAQVTPFLDNDEDHGQPSS